MHIETLASTCFRNLASKSISFSPSINVLIGKNGQGKTNVLESIYLFKLGRSFRTRRDNEMIRFGESQCKVEVSCKFNNGEREKFAVTIERDGLKSIKISGQTIPKLSDLVGMYPCVLFGPQDMHLVNGPPDERRRFIDITGSMTDRNYLKLLKEYRRVLQQRNAVLRQGGVPKELDVWDRELVKKGCALTDKRMNVVDALEKHIIHHNTKLSLPFDFRMVYESSYKDASMTNANPKDNFSMKLAAIAGEEIRRGITLVGPHRDEVRIITAGRELKRFGSQGQKRLLVVLLKLAELSYLEAELGESCILLLDDIFSEFDEAIGKKLRRHLSDGRQVFVTSPVDLAWENAHSTKVFQLENGEASL